MSLRGRVDFGFLRAAQPDPQTIKDIKVVETIKEGCRIYTANGKSAP